MSKNTILTAGLVLTLVVVLLSIVKYTMNKDNAFFNPLLRKPVEQQTLPSEVSSTIAAPKTLKLDRSTDLKKELESVNPLVLDSDFE